MEVLNIRDAPNWARARFGIAETGLDMRILRGALGCEHIGISYLRFGPGWRTTFGHRHPTGEEVYVLVEGRARIKVEDEIHEMEAPSAIRVRGDQFRSVRAEGDDPAVFVVAGYPIDDPELTEFASDFWPEDE
jgi:mannose-6-phosphate isomerase-like protein (cupin superfamily)